MLTDDAFSKLKAQLNCAMDSTTQEHFELPHEIPLGIGKVEDSSDQTEGRQAAVATTKPSIFEVKEQKVIIKHEFDDIYAKLEPLITEELYIKEEHDAQADLNVCNNNCVSNEANRISPVVAKQERNESSVQEIIIISDDDLEDVGANQALVTTEGFNVARLVGQVAPVDLDARTPKKPKKKPKRSIKCKKCKCTFATRNRLQWHMEVHTGRKLKCNLCAYQCTRQKTLHKHVRTYHRAVTIKKEVKMEDDDSTPAPKNANLLSFIKIEDGANRAPENANLLLSVIKVEDETSGF